MVKRLVIVGGGSAGWLTAGVIAAEHRARAGSGLQVTLLESPDVGPIGVGEGTWPTMRDTLRRIGVSESGFHPRVRRLLQAGLEVRCAGCDGRERRLLLPSLRPAAGLHRDQPGRRLAAAARQRAVRRPGELPAAPVRAGQGAQAGRDARVRGGGELRLPPRRRQVRRVPAQALRRAAWACATCSTTWSASSRMPTATSPRCRRATAAACEGDLFVDCTGLQSCCWAAYRRAVRVAAARAVQRHGAGAAGALRRRATAPIASQTISTAQSARLDLGHRIADAPRHRSRLLERAHVSDDDGRARAARTTWSAPPAGRPGMRTPRKLTFEPGYRAAVLAPQLRRHRTVGGLHRTAGGLGAGAGGAVRRHAQRRDAGDARGHGHRRAAIQRLLHLSLGAGHRFPEAALRAEPARRTASSGATTRRPSRFPTGCANLLALWRHQPPSRYDLHRVEEVFPSASYQYVLYGMGFRPEPDGFSRRARTMPIAPTNISAKRRSSLRKMLGGAAVQPGADRHTSGSTDCRDLRAPMTQHVLLNNIDHQ